MIFIYIIAQLTITGAVILLISAFLGVNMAILSPAISVFQIVYSDYCLKRLYQLNRKSIILKTLLFFLIAFMIYILLIITVLILLLIVNGPEYFIEMFEAQKALNA